MKRSTDFHVVVIDDKLKSCERISKRLKGLKISVDSEHEIQVSVSQVHVQVERLNRCEIPEQDYWTFNKKTIEELLNAAKKKADLLIVDYIYIDSQVANYFKDKGKQREVNEEETSNKALNPKDLYDWVLQINQLSVNDREQIVNNLFQADSTVYLHTYTPAGLHPVTGTMEQRNRMAALAFPRAKIHVIDTRAEFFNDEEFDWPGSDPKYDSNYYPYQLAVLFAQIVQKEVMMSLLTNRPRSRKVFVVHGRAEREKESIARFIEKLSLDTVILDEQTNLGRSVLKKFRDYADVGFAIVLLTGDDKGGLASEDPSGYALRVRQNVIFELGFFLAKLGEERVCCLRSPEVEVPSDYSGILDILLDEEGGWKYRLAKELKDAGFDVDLNNALL